MATLTSDRIEALLHTRGISARQMLLSLNLSPTALSEWKRGKAKPTVDALSKIANYFDVSIDYLVGNANPDTPPDGNMVLYGLSDFQKSAIDLFLQLSHNQQEKALAYMMGMLDNANS